MNFFDLPEIIFRQTAAVPTRDFSILINAVMTLAIIDDLIMLFCYQKHLNGRN
jgi:hypothetical protein